MTPFDDAGSAPNRPADLQARYAAWPAEALLAEMVCQVFPGRIALVSAFGADSVVLLHMLAAIDRATPVIFLDTGKQFTETLQYRDALRDRLRLTDLRSIQPDPARLAAADPDGTLWRTQPDLCCWQRKVEPLDAALAGFSAWITGRKRFQGGVRAQLPVVEQGANRQIKINPLAGWGAADIAAYLARHDLPRHPLLAQGYRSIGCAPCTRATRQDEDARAGRWAGQGKTECGIHLAGQR